MTDTAQGQESDTATHLLDAFDTERALTTLQALCAPDMSGRAPGSAGHALATEFLASTLASHGLSPGLDTFPIREVMRLAAQPSCRVDGSGFTRDLVHRAEFAENPRSGPMPAALTGTVSEAAGTGEWAALLKVPQGDAFAALADELVARGAIGILTAQNADASGYLTKRVQGPPPVSLPVIALRPDVLAASIGGAVTAHVPLVREPATGTNIIATLPGADPDARPILLTAHYDGVGADPELHFPCAGDNASGTAVLCEVARVLTSAAPLARPVVFALVDAEEIGTIGSGHHARRLREQGIVPDVLNVDMAGKDNGKVAVELGPADPSPTGVIAALDSAGRRLGIQLYAGTVSSDNRRYASAGFPAAGIGFGAAHYHSPLDAPDRIEPEALRKAGHLVLAAVHHLATQN
ncbi:MULTISPECIES: M28 family metallopeptidase [unclassified Streptomyces]|uniref:M28 family metallopeptidase n=1 Tax=unclassified Streptomyces TaxID=2593676 RepID=UPI00202EF15F|nr:MULTISPECIES: M28 family metallopeptidase [unclassified Streptomyces]MCM1965381.1 M28 family metallopeptidase [Streptomyces sp. G1]MCX5130040.1 M28 family metallopeptidase [Streptomyces sp. NBC_00347]MCX5301079.1 M28 family metallopeptidase [Streptomyces sp. NBC_00193]